MNSIPKSAELRALANIFGIDYSHINFRSAPQRRALYQQIQTAKAEQVPATESEANAELEQLRIENARLRLENQGLRDQLQSINKRLDKLEGQYEGAMSAIRVKNEELEKLGVPAVKHGKNKPVNFLKVMRELEVESQLTDIQIQKLKAQKS